jgi:tetratricopeptide (TPR) repeat protein
MSRIHHEHQNPTELFTEENGKAEALIAGGNLPEAAKILVDIVELDPENYRAYSNIGIIAWMRKAWDDAYSMFIKSVSIKPDYTDGLINLFDATLKLHRVKDLMPLLEKALSINPHDEELKILHEAIVKEGDGIYSSERGLHIGKHNPRIDEAQTLLEEGKLNLAMEKYLKINDEEGPSAKVFSGLGIISFYQQRYTDAFSLFMEAIKLNPTSRDDFLNLLDAAKACGKTDDAKKIFRIYRQNFQSLEAIAADFEN